MPDFKVTAYIHSEVPTKGNGCAGKLMLVTHDHKLASQVASNFGDSSGGYYANVDFEMRVPIGRKTVWLDASPASLDHAAENIMRAAQDLRDAQHNVKAKQA